MLRPLIVVSLLSGATAAFAGPVPLGGDALRDLAGSRVELDTPLGTKLPILFGEDGLVSADAGDLAPLLGSQKDRGRWWVENEKLCSKWFRWFDAEVRCITVSREGTKLYWVKDDGEKGTATLVEGPRTRKVEVASTTPAVTPATAPAAALPEPKGPVVPDAAQVPDVRPDETADIPPPVKKLQIVTASVAPSAIASTVEVPLPDGSVVPQLITRAEPDRLDEMSGQSMMRFGGAGLLEASARFGLEQPTVVAPSESAHAVSKAAARTVPLRAPSLAAHTASAQSKAAHSQKRSLGGVDKGRSPSAKPAAPESAAATLYKVRGVEEDDVLNIRRGPSEEAELVSTIPSTGRRVEVTGRCEKDWCPVRYGSAKGWVHRFYLAEESPRQASSSAVYFAKP